MQRAGDDGGSEDRLTEAGPEADGRLADALLLTKHALKVSATRVCARKIWYWEPDPDASSQRHLMRQRGPYPATRASSYLLVAASRRVYRYEDRQYLALIGMMLPLPYVLPQYCTGTAKAVHSILTHPTYRCSFQRPQPLPFSHHGCLWPHPYVATFLIPGPSHRRCMAA